MLSAKYSELIKGNKDFRHLWAGQMISELGTWFSFIAELGLVRMLSDSPLATTALLVSRTLPFFLASPLAGVFADRHSRKRILIAADLLRAGVALVYLTAGVFGSVWVVIACSAMMASLTMFFEAAKNASLPNLTTPRELLTANVLMYSTRFLQISVGAALGGFASANLGYDAAFVINSVSFVASALFIMPIPEAVMRQPRREPASPEVAGGGVDVNGTEVAAEPSGGQFFADLREGLAYIRATPFVRAIILVNIGWATGGGMTQLLLDRMGGHEFARSPSDGGDWNVAMLFTAGGAGLFIGMMMARRVGAWASGERRAGLFIGWMLLAQGLLMAAAGLMPTLALMAALIAMGRLLLAVEFGVQETMMMRVLPDKYRGRVFSTDRALEICVMSIATVASGWLLTVASPRTVMVISGLLSALPGVIWLLALSLTGFGVPARAVREQP